MVNEGQRQREEVMINEFDALSIQVSTSESASECAACGPALEGRRTKREERSPSSSRLSSSKKKYPAKTHARKVAKELGVSEGLILIRGEVSKTYKYSDMSPAFRQLRYFYYLTGANHPDCCVTYDLAADHLTLWVPYIEPRQILWYGHTPSPEQYRAKSDLDSVRYTNDLSSFLHAYFHHQHGKPTLYLLDDSQLPPRLGRDYFCARYEVQVNVTDLRPAVDEARVVKTEYEIGLIRKANDISSAAHRAVQERLGSLTNEREVQALFEHECAVRGAKRQAYAVIAGSGTNAATLHYDDNDQPLRGKQFLVLDAGCEVDCYASDVTRTLPLGGDFTPEARAVYDVVTKMQNACIAYIRPGVLYYSLHVAACQIAQAELTRLGILVGDDPAEVWEAGTVAAFFPHGLGHHVGLETHDPSGNTRLLLSAREEAVAGPRRSKRDMFSAEAFARVPYDVAADPSTPAAPSTYDDEDDNDVNGHDHAQEDATSSSPPPPYKGRQALRPGMIVTVEPGIYFCREYIEGYFLKSDKHRRFIDTDVLERYYHVGGVRIEDDILVTRGGSENLTSAPKGLDMVDLIRGVGGAGGRPTEWEKTLPRGAGR